MSKKVVYLLFSIVNLLYYPYLFYFIYIIIRCS